MKRPYSLTARLAAVVILALATLVHPSALQRRRPGVVRQTSIVNGRLAAAGEVLVKYRRPLAQFERLQFDQQTEADESHPVGRSGLRRVHSRRFDTAALLAFLRAHPDVEYAEPNYIVTADAVPNDTSFGQLWGLRNIGQTIGVAGTAGADISATSAWDISIGSRSIVVAITDTGIDYTHPDLAANVWTAAAPFSVVIGGVTIDCPTGTHGFNAITKSCGVADVWDDHGHGTHVAGTIGAVGNNGTGVVGVNWATTMMASKFLDSMGSGTLADSIDAIDFVIQAAQVTGDNVRVINASWSTGGEEPSQALLNEINLANSRNMLFVASAGNSSPTPNNNDVSPRYPAGYNAPNVVAVASTNNKDQLASDSNYGATTVHLAAPGVNVISTYPTDLLNPPYQFLSGTSMAAPHVAGAAALLLSTCTSLSAVQIKNTLLANIDPIPLLNGKVSTGGRLNVNKAIRACMPNFSMSATPSTQTDSAHTGTTYTATVTPSGGFTGDVAFSVSGLPTGVTASFAPTTVAGSGTSTMTLTPSASTPSGSFPLTITGTSGSGPSSIVHSTNVTYITSSGSAPVATADVATINEDTPTAIAVLSNDNDPDSDVLSVTGVTVPAHGTTAINPDKTITYSPALNYNGSDTFSYTIDDGHGGTAGATVSVTVTAINDVPSFTKGGNQTVLEDAAAQTVAAWATALSAGPADERSQTLDFIVTNDNNGLFSAQPAVASNGTLSYTPAANANGSATVTVGIHDTGGTANSGVDTSAAQTFTITVTAVNDTPSFTKGADQTVLENSGAQSVPGWATNLSAGPANETSQTLDFIVSSNNAALFSVQPAVSATGTLTYTPAANASGSATVTVQIHDNGGTANAGVDTSAAQTFTITITAVNDAPSFTKGANQTVAEDAPAQTVSGWATAISAGAGESGQALDFLVSNDNGPLFSAPPAVSATGTLSYTPAPNANGSATVTVRLHDNGGTANGGADTSAPQTFTITVTAVNDVPVATDQPVSTDEDTARSITLVATDVETVSLTYSIVAGPTHGSLTGTAPNVTYTPAANYNGSDSFTFKANDGTADSNVATVTITVNAVNDVPSFTQGADQTVLEDAGAQSVPNWATAISAGTGEGEQTVNFIVGSNNPSLFSVQPAISATGTLSYTPAANASGLATISVQIHDNGGTASGGVDTSATQTFTITVTGVNDAPVANDQSVGTVEDIAAAITLTGADADSNTLTFTIVTPPAHGVLSGTAPNLTFTPAPNWNGNDSFTFKVNDGLVDSNVATVTITVTPDGDAPTAANDSYDTSEDNPLIVSAPGILDNDLDVDSGSITAILVTQPAHGTLVLAADGGFTYTPAQNYNGPDTFTYKANDGALDSNIATVSIMVAVVDESPVAADKSVSTAEDTPASVILSATDEEGASLNYIVVTPPSHGTLGGVAPSLTYTPVQNYRGVDWFTYKANDGALDSNIAVVAITINAVNDPPIAVDDNYATNENVALTVPAPGILGNDSDLDSVATGVEPIIVAWDASNDGNVQGYVVHYGMAPGEYSNTVDVGNTTVWVANGLVAGQEYYFAVSAYTSDEVQSTLSGGVSATPTTIGGVDSGTLAASVVSGPVHGTLTQNSNGGFTYRPAPNYDGPDLFTYRTTDGVANSNVATVTITVTPVNDAPVAINQAVTTNEDTAKAIRLSATDVEGSALTYTIVTPPAHGTLSGTAPNVTYTPAANYNGADSFTFKAKDGTLDSNTATVTITVTAVTRRAGGDQRQLHDYRKHPADGDRPRCPHQRHRRGQHDCHGGRRGGAGARHADGRTPLAASHIRPRPTTTDVTASPTRGMTGRSIRTWRRSPSR